MSQFDLDPNVTEAEQEAAQRPPSCPFPIADQDDFADEAHRLVAAVPNTPAEALVVAKHYTDANINVGLGMCLRTVRTYFDVAALWPDANDAQEHSDPFTKVTDPNQLPRGSVGYCRNPHHGHVWINLGGGLCRTTDFHRPGMVDIARVSDVVTWAGGFSLGWGQVLNNVDVWPAVEKPAHPAHREPWSRQRRLEFLRFQATRLRRDGRPHKADQLTQWANRLENR